MRPLASLARPDPAKARLPLFEAEAKQTELQQLQAGLLDLVRRSRETDELTALAFQDFLIDVAAREGARRR